MPAKPDQQPEHHKPIQALWEEAQKRYNPVGAVMAAIASPDVSARGKIFLGLSCVTTTGLTMLGYRSPELAIGGIMICNLSIALLTKDSSQPRDGPGRPRPPKPRPRRRH